MDEEIEGRIQDITRSISGNTFSGRITEGIKFSICILNPSFDSKHIENHVKLEFSERMNDSNWRACNPSSKFCAESISLDLISVGEEIKRITDEAIQISKTMGFLKDNR